MIEKVLSLYRNQNAETMKYSEVEKKLKDHGCRWYKNGKRHPVWYSPVTDDYFLLSYHGREEVATGTLKEISKKSGVKL